MQAKNTLAGSKLSVLMMLVALCATGWSGEQTIAKTGVWETLTCTGSPTARHECDFVEFNGKFYLIGGRGIKAVEVFDPETNSWEQRGPTPFELHHFQAVAIGDTIYIVCAMTGEYPVETPLANVYLYLPSTDTWIKGSEIPENRRRGSAGAVVYHGKIYLVAGIQLGHTSGTIAWFDMFDPQTGEWTELGDAPHIRDHFHAIVVDDKLYCIGGRNTSRHVKDDFAAFFSATEKAVDCYDFVSKTWTTLENELPIGTAAGGVARLGDAIYYTGGESGQPTAHSETQRLDLATGTWSLAAPLNRGRHGSAAINYKNKLYIAAGSGNRGGGPELASTERYTPDSQWFSLFNGHDLDGWQVKCQAQDKDKKYWTVQDGAITCNSMQDKDHNYVWLMSDQEFDNFELVLQFKAFRESPGNSGVQFRSRYDDSSDAPHGGRLDGPQVDIHPPTPFRTGLIYDETRGENRWIHPSLESWKIDSSYAAPKWTFYYADQGWNDLTIRCNGMRIKTILNGDVITDWDGKGVLDNQVHKDHHVDKSGHIALQLHVHDALKIQFKNLKIRRL